ncbi:MAG: hypothetical protein JKY50_01065, partial [Oleispira sp.]|nr:hypothetical protein [Oleispira sp.]
MFYAILGICSNPDCQIFTLGPTEDGSKSINQGRAAHITAASPLGPRYEKTLTKDERRHADNGIWLCIACANLIDEDVDKYPVSLLNSWKAQAQYETYLRVVDRVKAPQSRTAHNATLKRRLQKAVADDAKKFRTQQGWPIIEIELGFRIVSNDHHRVINLAGLCDGLSVNTELLLTSPPGTGKTTTMLQITDKLVELDRFVPLFLPLKEWAHSSADFIDTILTRNSFAAFNRQEILTLAENGEIAVLLDGWNELSSTTKVNAISNVTALRRDFPLLPIITSTRREAMDLPFGGIRADIQALSEQQQLQIAKSVLGTSGHDLLDRAWRTPSIRDIVAIPLYLSVLLAAAPDGALPDTKERLLGLLIEHHEKGTGNNQLREDTQSKHTDFLAALAFEALSQGEIAIADERAKKVIIAEGKRLVELGQIVAASEPMAVLDALVAHHVLIRSEDGLISFQHQQFQEWFASLKVEQLMVAAIDDADAMQVLKSDIFNYPFWEESILFAVDRMSSQEDQQNIVSTCVLGALFVDPMLAAEMVFHLPKATWAKISDDITAFVKRWHRPGMVDRAVGFMIKTGKGEFAEAFWPLASNTDMQVHLSAMRATQPFRIGVMGDNIAVHLSTLDEETKTHVLGELAMNGDVSSMEQAVALAKQDSSSKLRVEVISSLDFRQADRLAVDLLNASNSCVWQSVASKRLLQDIDDSEVILRLTEEQQKFFSEETNPTRLLYYIAHGHKTEDAEEQLAELISRPDFPAREQDIGWSLRQTYQRFPAAVLKGILQRVERGLELPWGADDLLNELPTVDKGKIAKRALEKSKERGEQNDAVKIAGPNTVGKLIDRFLKQNTMLIGSEKQSTQDEMDIYHSTMDRIVDTRFEPFAQAILCKGRVKDLPTITLLADLLSRHMSVDLDKQRLSPEPKTIVQLIELIGGWVEFILASSDANRHDLSEIARVITCFPDECHLAGLTKLLHEDLNRYREARARHLGGVILPEASMSYGHQYRSAFAAIGGKGAVLILEDHLLDDLFGEDAAHGLRDIYDKRTGTKQSSRSFPEFANVEERRTAITTSGKEE